MFVSSIPAPTFEARIAGWVGWSVLQVGEDLFLDAFDLM